MNLVQNPEIKRLLLDRWKELDIRVSDVIKDAEERGMKLCPVRMSRYKTGNHKAGISESQLIWLATRYGIFITFNIGEPMIVDGKLKYDVKPYNELRCLLMLNKIFPNGKER
jgi:hypothetical protein